MFHVKPFIKVNKTISLTYTKLPEDHVEEVLHVDPSEQPPQRLGCDSQILRSQFFALLDCSDAPSQRHHGLLQKSSLPLPIDQTALACAKIILRKRDQGRDQLLDAIALARRDFKLGTIRSLPRDADWRSAIGRIGSVGVEIDLVAHHPGWRAVLVQTFLA